MTLNQFQVCVCVCKYTVYVCVRVCVGFCTAVSVDFSYFPQLFLHSAFWAALLSRDGCLQRYDILNDIFRKHRCFSHARYF